MLILSLGYQSLNRCQQLAMKVYNVAIGSVNNNVAMGYLAGNNFTVAGHNTALGTEALASEDVGDFTVAIGYRTGYYQNSDSNTEDTGNTLVGTGAGFYNVTGTNNTLLGRQAGLGVSGQSNSDNVAIGYKALYGVTTGHENTVIGKEAAYTLTTADNNVIIGFQSGYSLTSARYNVLIGDQAGYSLSTTSDNNENVMIGNSCW